MKSRETNQLPRTIGAITGSASVIDRKELPAGLYFFQLKHAQEVVATGKLMVE